jgi:hypothetical protein
MKEEKKEKEWDTTNKAKAVTNFFYFITALDLLIKIYCNKLGWVRMELSW